MDKLKGFAEKALSGSSSSNTGNTANPANPEGSANTGNAAGGQDYLDKGLAEIERRTGHSQSAETNEKITDKAREFYESKTGTKVNSKFSN